MTSAGPGAARDVLARLLPEAAGELERRARRTATLLRLLDAEARSRAPVSVGLGAARARNELERERRAAAVAAVGDLAVHHLEVALGPERFVSLPRARLGVQQAWTALEELRAGGLELPRACSPAEPAEVVATRMLAALRTLAPRALATRRLEAALVSRLESPEAGERAFRRLAGRVESWRLASRVGRLECLLDRGQVAAARRLSAAWWGRDGGGAEAAAGTLARDPELARAAVRLAAWVRLLADGVLPVEPPPSGPLPLALVELRRRRPAWRAALRGRLRGGARRPPLEPLDWEGARAALGASVLAAFEPDGRGRARLVALDALRPPRGAAREDFEHGPRPELERVARGEPWLVHAPGGALTGALDARARSAAAWPTGEGWIWLELEHHLLPSSRRLESLARAWRGHRPAVPVPAAAHMGAASEGRLDGERTPDAAGSAPGPDPVRARREVFRGLLQGLAADTAGRRWRGVALEPGGLRVVAGGGAGAGSTDEADRLDTAALEAALRLGAPLRDQGRRGERATRLVLPLSSRGRGEGALVLESARGGDFGGAWTARLGSRARGAGDRLRAAAFRDWHRVTRGGDVWCGLETESARALFERVLAAAGCGRTVAVVGPEGAGKSVVAAWVQFERGRARGAPSVPPVEADTGDTAAGLAALARAAAGPLVVEELQRLPPVELERLARADLGLVATLTAERLRALGERGVVPPAVARALERDEVPVPALSLRRSDVPHLARGLLASSLEELGRAPVEPSEEALAWLWRQPWRGNVRELATLLYRAAVELPLDPARAVRVGDVASVAARLAGGSPDAAKRGPAGDGGSLELPLLRRITSRLELPEVLRLPPEATPDTVVRQALEATRTARGALHRQRAASYLGWHPGTLARRLKALGPGTPGDGPPG